MGSSVRPAPRALGAFSLIWAYVQVNLAAYVMWRIAVDAMGTDSAPHPEVEGAVLAARAGLAEVLLVGPESALRGELARRREARSLPIEVVHASEAITMEDHAAKAFRRKRDSSMRVAAQLVRSGRADGLVSAGNTGAVMTTAKIVLGALEGVDRPFQRHQVPFETSAADGLHHFAGVAQK